MQVAQVFAWLDKLADDKLMLSTSLQTQPDKALFFTRNIERLILPDNIQVEVSGGWGPLISAVFTSASQGTACVNARTQEVVQVGVIQGGDTMQALLRLMSTLYAPQFITGSLWPESIKKDFIGMMLLNHQPCACVFATITKQPACNKMERILWPCRSTAQVLGKAYRDKPWPERQNSALPAAGKHGRPGSCCS